jgi:FtsX-like permease family protein
VNLATLVQLSRPSSATDRSRFRLLVTTIALAGAFLLAAWRIKRLGFSTSYDSAQYSDYIQESGIRGGVAIAALLLSGAACLLAFQSLMLGTTARDRRLAAFRLAGATPRQVRGLGGAEAGIAGLAGGVLAGPLYLLLTLAIQALPRTARILPPGNHVDLATWPVVAAVLAVAAVLVGALLGRGVVPDPRERSAKPSTVSRAVIAAVTGLGIVVLFRLFENPGNSLFSLVVLPGIAVLLVSLALPTLLVAWQGNRLTRSGNPLKVLAGGRLLRTVQPLSRTLVLLIICGTAIGFVISTAVELVRTNQGGPVGRFQLTGFAFAAGAAVLIALIAGVALLAGTADDLLDQRRQLAALNILGIGENELRISVRHQLTSCITPAVTTGLAIGGLLHADLAGRQLYPGNRPSELLPFLVMLVVGAGLTWLIAAAAAYLLRRQVHEATAAENLRST